MLGMRRCTVLLLFVSVVVLSFGGQSFARTRGDLRSFVEISPTARSRSFGGAGVAYYPYVESLFGNPACLRLMERDEVSVSYAPLWADVSYANVAFAHVGLSWGFGVGYTQLSSGTITKTDAAGRAIGHFADVYRLLAAGFAFPFHEDLSAGVSVTGFSQEFDGEIRYGYGINVGLSARFYEGFYGGLLVKNASAKWGFPKTPERISPKVGMGLAFAPRKYDLLVSVQWWKQLSGSYAIAYGVEYKLFPGLVLRTGYANGMTFGLDLAFGDVHWNTGVWQHELGAVREYSVVHELGLPVWMRRIELEPNPKWGT